MNCFKIITDEDFGVKNLKMDNPRTRLGARGIVINNKGQIAILNKQVKNEYKLVGGGIDENEEPEVAFKREVLEEAGCEIEIIKSLGTIEEHKSYDNFKQISCVFVAKVIKNINELNLTEKEINEDSKLIWLDPTDALNKISDCAKNLKASEYENLYHSKFIVLRDKIILEYYINNL